MVTKADVRAVVTEVVSEIVPPMINNSVNKAKHEIMDYVDRKDREYKGELKKLTPFAARA